MHAKICIVIMLFLFGCGSNPIQIDTRPYTGVSTPTLDLCAKYISQSISELSDPITTNDSVGISTCNCLSVYPETDFISLISGPEPHHNRGYNKDAELEYVEIIHKNYTAVEMLRNWCEGEK